MNPLKDLYIGNEIIHQDYLYSIRDNLIADFFNIHPDYENMTDKMSFFKHDPNGWDCVLIKQNQKMLMDDVESKYPTIYNNILQHWGESCIGVAYGVLRPNGLIHRHADDKDGTLQKIRIHLPLIVPEGDLGMEVNGQEVHWDELFAFDVRKVHTAWNFTDKPRLILLIDLFRNVCDLPESELWTWESVHNAEPFPKLYGDMRGVPTMEQRATYSRI
jgi:hypothetical protein